ncbi:hypothetical protein AVEN_30028-1 [Araneus ventricosus]|uniref:Uncharacterized protein n=1 Tax=Araneus ventricosus TaxID=182803 RepID=A0A4Y2SMK8_ARAVE|nr:hypothetical protein AVEN_112686-1 [Araneus ventricosus]GBN89552.1 hypothetical protein AVEN_235823-1 [Araneus ventricosus]GBN90054.1 hypothetical protein AVEN_3927-1 [Araneus ventricosus]GBN90063.1 hypothetical protein AVEN_30028-1 [Araneus ventricosus]
MLFSLMQNEQPVLSSILEASVYILMGSSVLKIWSKETRFSSSNEAGCNLTVETLPSKSLGSMVWSLRWLAFPNVVTLTYTASCSTFMWRGSIASIT